MELPSQKLPRTNQTQGCTKSLHTATTLHKIEFIRRSIFTCRHLAPSRILPYKEINILSAKTLLQCYIWYAKYKRSKAANRIDIVWVTNIFKIDDNSDILIHVHNYVGFSNLIHQRAPPFFYETKVRIHSLRVWYLYSTQAPSLFLVWDQKINTEARHWNHVKVYQLWYYHFFVVWCWCQFHSFWDTYRLLELGV